MFQLLSTATQPVATEPESLATQPTDTGSLTQCIILTEATSFAPRKPTAQSLPNKNRVLLGHDWSTMINEHNSHNRRWELPLRRDHTTHKKWLAKLWNKWLLLVVNSRALGHSGGNKGSLWCGYHWCIGTLLDSSVVSGRPQRATQYGRHQLSYEYMAHSVCWFHYDNVLLCSVWSKNWPFIFNCKPQSAFSYFTRFRWSPNWPFCTKPHALPLLYKCGYSAN